MSYRASVLSRLCRGVVREAYASRIPFENCSSCWFKFQVQVWPVLFTFHFYLFTRESVCFASHVRSSSTILPRQSFPAVVGGGGPCVRPDGLRCSVGKRYKVTKNPRINQENHLRKMQTKKKKMTAMVDSIRMILRSFSVNGLETKGLSFFMSRANCLIITHVRFNFIFMWSTGDLVIWWFR